MSNPIPHPSVAARTQGPDPASIQLAALACLARRARDGEARTTFEDVAEALEIRRTDARRALSQLAAEGLYDALKARLTMRGFAAGHALSQAGLRPLRECRVDAPSAACHAA